jgi:hypothetical protein
VNVLALSLALSDRLKRVDLEEELLVTLLVVLSGDEL